MSAENSGLTTTGSNGTWSTVLTKTLDQPNVLATKATIRQAIRGAEISGSGNVIRVTFAAHTATMVGSYINKGMKLAAASIVQRSGTTGYVGTTTPTAAQIQWSSAGCSVVAAGEITTTRSCTSINPANDYLVIMDFRVDLGSTGPVPLQQISSINYNRYMPARALSGGAGMLCS